MTCTTYRQIFFLLTFLLHGVHAAFCEDIPVARALVPCELKPFDSNTLVVTSNADDINDPTTLRGVLAIAQAGDVIAFDLPVGSDEIILDPNSPLIVDTTVIVDGTNLAGSGSGEQLVSINGDFTNDNIGDTNVCFIIESTAPTTTIKNIIIKQFNGHDLITGSGTDNVELPAYGVWIQDGAIACTITNCTITDIISGENQPAAGIFSETDTCPITDNTIENISSASPVGSASIDSGDVSGISIFGIISGDCTGNTIFNLMSGDSNNRSGEIFGIIAIQVIGDCSHNTISQLESGTALFRSGDIEGIQVEVIAGPCAYNTINSLQTGTSDESGSIFGIRAVQIQGVCQENQIFNLVTGSGTSRSGAINGITTTIFDNHILENIIYLLESGPAARSGSIFGLTNSFNVVGNCSFNTITGLFSGSATIESGAVVGCRFLKIEGSFSGNSIGTQLPGNPIINSLISGNANTESGIVFGYFFDDDLGSIDMNTVTNLSSGNASEVTGDISGIQSLSSLLGNCSNNTVTFLSSGNIESIGTDGTEVSRSGNILGISIANVSGTCIENLISDLSSGSALGSNDSSGNVTGITFETLLGRLWSNIAMRLSSGPADQMSGNIIGITVTNYLRGDAANNTVQIVMAGDADTIGYVRGIWLVMVQYDRLIACNVVDQMQGGNDEEDSFGLAIEMGDRLSICQNTITNLIGTDSTVMHGMLFGNENEGRMLTNSTISDNFIQNIMGGNNTNGFGITIVNPNSLGNRILNNSIFEINGKAINIVDNNVETDAGTIVTAPIILHWVICAGNGTIRIGGELFPHPDFDQEEFLLQFFASDMNVPPQAMTFIGEATIEADGSPTPFIVEFKPTIAIFDTQFITATATALVDPNKNTSEVSPPIAGCNSARPECLISMLNCIEPPDPCPISLEDAPPLEPPCPATPCGPCPC